MKHGDIVICNGRRGVALYIDEKTRKNNGVNIRRAGLHVFAGYWYGHNPLSHKSYGKVLTCDGIGVGSESAIVVGKVTTNSHSAVKNFHRI